MNDKCLQVKYWKLCSDPGISLVAASKIANAPLCGSMCFSGIYRASVKIADSLVLAPEACHPVDVQWGQESVF